MRSACPINFALESLGDQWSLLIIRDLVFSGKTTYGEFLKSAEGISTNILANRLTTLCEAGLISKHRNPNDARASIYRLTEKGVALVPALFELILWGVDYGDPPEELVAWVEDVKKDKQGTIDKKVQSLLDDLKHA